MYDLGMDMSSITSKLLHKTYLWILEVLTKPKHILITFTKLKIIYNSNFKLILNKYKNLNKDPNVLTKPPIHFF